MWESKMRRRGVGHVAHHTVYDIEHNETHTQDAIVWKQYILPLYMFSIGDYQQHRSSVVEKVGSRAIRELIVMHSGNASRRL